MSIFNKLKKNDRKLYISVIYYFENRIFNKLHKKIDKGESGVLNKVWARVCMIKFKRLLKCFYTSEISAFYRRRYCIRYDDMQRYGINGYDCIRIELLAILERGYGGRLINDYLLLFEILERQKSAICKILELLEQYGIASNAEEAIGLYRDVGKLFGEVKERLIEYQVLGNKEDAYNAIERISRIKDKEEKALSAVLTKQESKQTSENESVVLKSITATV